MELSKIVPLVSNLTWIQITLVNWLALMAITLITFNGFAPNATLNVPLAMDHNLTTVELALRVLTF